MSTDRLAPAAEERHAFLHGGTRHARGAAPVLAQLGRSRPLACSIA